MRLKALGRGHRNEPQHGALGGKAEVPERPSGRGVRAGEGALCAVSTGACACPWLLRFAWPYESAKCTGNTWKKVNEEVKYTII